MLIPPSVKKLLKRNTTFGHPTSQNTIVGKGAWLSRIRAIHIQNSLRFIGKVRQFRHRTLHAESHLILGNAGLNFRITHIGKCGLIDFPHGIQKGSTILAVHSTWVIEIEHRFSRTPELDPLMAGRQETAAPQARIQSLALTASLGNHHDIRGKILIGASQAIA